MTGRPPRAGFILLTVLAASALLAGLVGALAVVARGTVETVRIDRDRLAADALLDAGVTLAAYQLIALKRPLAEVDAQQVRFDAGVVRLAVTGEDGRVDLNAAPPALLAAAWRAAKRRSLSPEVFAARVVDWRDEDGNTDNGAEGEAYVAAGRPPPRDGPFRTVGDLRAVLGVTAEDADALAPFVTVYSGAEMVSAWDVSRDLATALGVSQGALERMRKPAETDEGAPSPTRAGRPVAATRGSGEDDGDSASDFVSPKPSKSFRIRAEFLRDGRPVAGAEAVVIPSPAPGVPFRVVARRS